MKNHLVMSDTAQRRDVSDPKTVRDFVALVQSPEMLRLLLVLTVADIRAVGPGVWNGWKGQLLRELYYAAEHMMTGGDQAPARGARVAAAKAALAARLADLTPEQRERALTRHYDNYWLAFDTDEQERHARLMTKADAERRAADPGRPTTNASAPSPRSCSTRPTMPACSRNSPAPSPCRAAPSSTPRPSPPRDGFALDVFSVQDAEGEAFGDRRAAGPPAPDHRKDPARRNLAAPRADRPAAAAHPRQRLQHHAQGAFRQ